MNRSKNSLARSARSESRGSRSLRAMVRVFMTGIVSARGAGDQGSTPYRTRRARAATVAASEQHAEQLGIRERADVVGCCTAVPGALLSDFIERHPVGRGSLLRL